jgi:hypothetical protein
MGRAGLVIYLTHVVRLSPATALGQARTPVTDAPDEFHTQILTITGAAVSTRPAPRYPGAPAGLLRPGFLSRSGANSGRGHSNR